MAWGFGLLMTAWTAFFRHRERKAIRVKRLTNPVAVERALRTGEAPADTTQDRAMLALIEYRRRQWQRGSRIVPWLFVAVAALCLVGAFATKDISWLVLGGLYVGLVVFLWVWSTRAVARFDRLESSIRTR